jgi:hypothetical protein
LPKSIPSSAHLPCDEAKAEASCPCGELQIRFASEGTELPLDELRSYFRTLTAPSILTGISAPSSSILPSTSVVASLAVSSSPQSSRPKRKGKKKKKTVAHQTQPAESPPLHSSEPIITEELSVCESRFTTEDPLSESDLHAGVAPIPLVAVVSTPEIPLSAEPVVAEKPLTCDARFDDVEAVCLVDSGSQADVILSSLAHQLGLPIHRLLAPLHADLGAEGHAVRLALYLTVSFTSGIISLPQRSFFVAPLPEGIDAILGLPWLSDTGAAVSADSVFCTPAGPNEPIVDLTSQRFVVQPQQNLEDLGFVNTPMSTEDQHCFALCAMISGMTDADEYIDYEPYNPLLDIHDDDPLQPDISEEECEEQLQVLLREFSDVLVDELPAHRPAPFRPVNHRIPLIDPEEHVHPRVYPIPDRYKAQFAAHASKFVSSGWWSPAALESACAMFAVPKHDKSEARFVVNLKPRNANTRKMTSSLPDMRSIRVTVASHRYRTRLDFKSAYEQVRVDPRDVQNTGFATPLGTFISHVMQQGDCNC